MKVQIAKPQTSILGRFIYVTLLAFALNLCSSTSNEGDKRVGVLQTNSSNSEFDDARIDAYALATPEEEEKNLHTLSHRLTSPYRSERAKARAIFRWIADRVVYNWPALLSGKTQRLNTDADYVLRHRTTICDGYTNLFNELARIAGLESVKVVGASKGYVYSPSQKLKSDHAWNAVQIDGQWQLLDVTWAAGDPVTEKSDHTFNDFYFLTAPEAFINDHLPDDKKWQLLQKPIEKKEFQKRVNRHAQFYQLGIDYLTPDQQLLRSKEYFVISLEGPQDLEFSAKLGNFENRYFHESDGTSHKVHILSPGRGKYELNIFAKHKSTSGSLPAILTYNVQFDGGHRDFQFATVYEGGHQIHSPMDRYLYAYKLYDFRLRVPGASEIAFIDGSGKWTRYLRRNSDEFYIRQDFPPGRLSINANFGQQSWPALVEYELR
jgi:hypothetical protein